MPPKAKITKEMIIEAGLDIVRKKGHEGINARSVAEKLGCSTQPVMYHFEKIEDLKNAVYNRADEFHTNYIMNVFSENPMLDIGLLYIRFAAQEKHLYKFLFQSDRFSGKSITQLINAEGVSPIVSGLSKSSQLNESQAKEAFRILFLVVQGYASLLANNSIEYDEETVSKELLKAFKAAVYAVKAT